MADPSYINVTSAQHGLAADETGINISSVSQTVENTRNYIMDKSGGRTGWAEDFDISSPVVLTGETTTAPELVMAAAFGTALTVANALPDGAYGLTGGVYMESIAIEQTQEDWQTATINATVINGIPTV